MTQAYAGSYVLLRSTSEDVTITDPKGVIVIMKTKIGDNIRYKVDTIGTYIITGCSQRTLNVISDIDIAHSIVSLIPETVTLGKTVEVYIKLFTMSGNAKETGGDKVNIICNAPYKVLDLENGCYRCIIRPVKEGVLTLSIIVDNKRLGKTQYISVDKPSLWTKIIDRCCGCRNKIE